MPWSKMDNPTLDPVDSLPFQGLMIHTDGPDKKTQEVLTTPIPPLEQEAVGTAPKDGQTKLETVPKEEEEQVAWELREQIEAGKFRLYIGQLSPEESDTDIEMNRSDYPFLD